LLDAGLARSAGSRLAATGLFRTDAGNLVFAVAMVVAHGAMWGNMAGKNAPFPGIDESPAEQ